MLVAGGFFVCFEQLGRVFAVAFRIAVVACLSNQDVLGSNLPALTETGMAAFEAGSSRDIVCCLAADSVAGFPISVLAAVFQKDGEAGS